MITRRPSSVDAPLESVQVQSGGRAAEPPRFQMGARGGDGGDGWQRREERKVKRANNAEGEQKALSPSPLFGVRKKTKKKRQQNNKCRVRRAGSQFSFESSLAGVVHQRPLVSAAGERLARQRLPLERLAAGQRDVAQVEDGQRVGLRVEDPALQRHQVVAGEQQVQVPGWVVGGRWSREGVQGWGG